jgi:glycine/D-amino acid oxidase-like deaminating enzyme
MFRHHVPVDPVTGVSPCFAEHDQHDCGDAQGNRDCDHHWFFNVLASTKAALCTGEWSPNHFDGLYLCEPVDLLSSEAISEMIGSDRFHGGLVYQRAGTLNPTGSCRVLARAARGAGAEKDWRSCQKTAASRRCLEGKNRPRHRDGQGRCAGYKRVFR